MEDKWANSGLDSFMPCAFIVCHFYFHNIRLARSKGGECKGERKRELTWYIAWACSLLRVLGIAPICGAIGIVPFAIEFIATVDGRLAISRVRDVMYY